MGKLVSPLSAWWHSAGYRGETHAEECRRCPSLRAVGFLHVVRRLDLKRQNAVLQAAQDDLGQLRTQLWEAQAEVENIKAIATVSENTKQEAIDEVKRQWREEVASLQAVMKGKDRERPVWAVMP
ncbi:hypothetical protein GH733_018606 [Mirounga leonina]|nr:hypothetical protein GH733_018606 [Mirounga leonina]